MGVILEAIKFNHDRSSATTDAFTIRRNETQPVIPPEWQRGISLNPEDSPAAYALDAILNQTLTVKARITCSEPEVKTFWIRAVDGNVYPERFGLRGIWQFALALLRPFLRRVVKTNVLGAVSPKQISPSIGPEDYRTFELKDVRLEEAGTGVNEIIWRWQFSLDERNWTDVVVTRHRIYTVFQMPAGAWQPLADESNNQTPWTEVLEYACRWAAGASSEKDIATQITSAVNSLGPAFIHYDNNSNGSARYTPNGPRRFDCQRLIDLLRGDSTNTLDPNVNCDDCAAMVSSFSSILGYALPVSSMKPRTPPKFFLRNHLKIGLDWDPIDSFSHHTVAWRGGDEDEVSDACLKLDTNQTGLGEPIAFLSGHLRFGIIGEDFYRHLLAVDENCMLTPNSTVYRCIGIRPTMCAARPSDHDLEQTKRDYDYDGWRTPETTQPLLDLNILLKPRDQFGDWVVRSARLIPPDSVELFLSRGEEAEEVVVRIDAYLARTAHETDQKLLRVLDRFEKPGVTIHKDTGIGDKSFANDSGFVILFSRVNLVILIRNVTAKPIVLWTIAQFIDTLLLGKAEEFDDG